MIRKSAPIWSVTSLLRERQYITRHVSARERAGSPPRPNHKPRAPASFEAGARFASPSPAQSSTRGLHQTQGLSRLGQLHSMPAQRGTERGFIHLLFAFLHPLLYRDERIA